MLVCAVPEPQRLTVDLHVHVHVHGHGYRLWTPGREPLNPKYPCTDMDADFGLQVENPSPTYPHISKAGDMVFSYRDR